MSVIRDYLLSKLQKTCKHPSHRVSVDINEGDSVPLNWCKVCGAYKFKSNDYWNIPRPEWYD